MVRQAGHRGDLRLGRVAVHAGIATTVESVRLHIAHRDHLVSVEAGDGNGHTVRGDGPRHVVADLSVRQGEQ